MLSSFSSSLLGGTLFLAALAGVTDAYIPAQAVNNTASLSNRTDSSSLDFAWVQGTFNTIVSLQLTADKNTSDFFPNEFSNGGVDRGALVHFSEDQTHNNDTSGTPWIAFISCDRNATDMSYESDIFTLARDRGAMAALLYSNTTAGCQLNNYYLTEFEKPLDVFTTRNKDDALILESQFEKHCAPAFYTFDPALLNASFTSVASLLNGTYPVTNSYLVAVLKAYNATSSDGFVTPSVSVPSSAPSQSSGGGGSSPGTSLGMIILYAITGCITLLFIIVIVSGAVRAMRHPERYGPRAGLRDYGSEGYPNYDDPRYGGPGGLGSIPVGPPQTRTAGLARAIVDTFPIIKFVRRSSHRPEERDQQNHRASDHKRVSRFELPAIPHQVDDGHYDNNDLDKDDGVAADNERSSQRPPSSHRQQWSSSSHGSRHGAHHRQSSHLLSNEGPFGDSVLLGPNAVSVDVAAAAPHASSSGSSSRRASAAGELDDSQVLEDSGESCAICLLEFEEGDDLRVLPCEGQHRFHKDCIDNWLLDVSGNCPLCRKDFSQALEEPLSSVSTSSLPLAFSSDQTAPPAPLPSRINRYLASVRASRKKERTKRRTSSSGNGADDGSPSAVQQASGLNGMLSGTTLR